MSSRYGARRKVPFPVRQELARVFGLPFSAVRVIVPYVGGGYGAKSGIKTEGIAACLSRMTGRPVKLAFGADETFKTICQPRAKMTRQNRGEERRHICRAPVRGLFKRRRLRQLGAVGDGKSGLPRARSVPDPASPDQCLFGLHQYGSRRGVSRLRRTASGVRLRDAHRHDRQRLGIDPFEIRMKNLLDKGESFSDGDTPIDCDLKAGLQQSRASDRLGCAAQRRAEIGVQEDEASGSPRAMKDGGGTNKPANAAVTIFNDGSVLLSTGSVEVGQGMRTAFLQVVAEELSVPTEKVRVAALDTHYTPFDKGTNASSATSIMGQAVLKAARDARRAVSRSGRVGVKGASGRNRLENGMAICGEQKLNFPRGHAATFPATRKGRYGAADFSKLAKMKTFRWATPSPFWEIGFGAAEVEVDAETGEVKVLRYVSLTDAGKMINPLQCHAQDEGAAVFGLGQALFEDLAYQDGQFSTAAWWTIGCRDSRICRDAFTTFIMEGGGGPGPYGAKGMGEGGILAVAPAMGNAVLCGCREKAASGAADAGAGLEGSNKQYGHQNAVEGDSSCGSTHPSARPIDEIESRIQN